LYVTVGQLNIARFEDLLKTDIDVGRRSVILKLLLAEEKMLGYYSAEHLAIVDQYIVENDEFIARQRTIIDELSGDGHARAAKSAKELLDTLIKTQALYHEHRAHIRDYLLK
jgi:hypothetical protein